MRTLVLIVLGVILCDAFGVSWGYFLIAAMVLVVCLLVSTVRHVIRSAADRRAREDARTLRVRPRSRPSLRGTASALPLQAVPLKVRLRGLLHWLTVTAAVALIGLTLELYWKKHPRDFVPLIARMTQDPAPAPDQAPRLTAPSASQKPADAPAALLLAGTAAGGGRLTLRVTNPTPSDIFTDYDISCALFRRGGGAAGTVTWQRVMTSDPAALAYPLPPQHQEDRGLDLSKALPRLDAGRDGLDLARSACWLLKIVGAPAEAGLIKKLTLDYSRQPTERGVPAITLKNTGHRVFEGSVRLSCVQQFFQTGTAAGADTGGALRQMWWKGLRLLPPMASDAVILLDPGQELAVDVARPDGQPFRLLERTDARQPGPYTCWIE
ncbi:hypothetical protein [Novispirillum itersonii]|uniref:hypothetical protein n=1 Tax=Novispirillum itersonii TaxID=189 RepID=UPI0012DC8021|nr:hypothetical protein [Novispirillum itersonii]